MAASKSIVMEIKGIQRLVQELHRKLEPDRVPVKVPSWKFPGKGAIEVDVSVLLQESDPHLIEEDRSFLLELLIDRLLLLLQTFIVTSDTKGSSPLPLSLSTAAKKVSKLLSRRDSVLSTKHQAYPVPIVESVPKLASENASSTADTSCQTLETAFTSCEYCNTKTGTLISVAQKLGDVCHSTCGRSLLADTNWRRLNELGKLKEMGIVKAFNDDIGQLRTCHERLKSMQVSQQETIRQQEALVAQLELQCTSLHSNMVQLKQQLDVTETNCQKSAEKLFAERIQELTRKLDLEVIKSELLFKESTNLKRTESKLREKIATQIGVISQTEELIEQSQNNETKLEKLNSELSQRVSDLEVEIESQKNENQHLNGAVDRGTVLLRKAQMQVSNLNNKCKKLMSEQVVLVDRIKELDDQRLLLDEQLVAIQEEKYQIDQQLQETSDLVTKYKADISIEKENVMSLTEERCGLQQQINLLKDKLQEESDSKHLLMEFPYTSDINCIQSTADERRCVCANVVRIMLLEEQNLELRRRHRPKSPSVDTSCHPLELDHPVRLWQSIKCLSQNATPCQATNNRLPLRGRIGHLVAALSHSTVQQPVAVDDNHHTLQQPFFCAQCNLIYLSEDELDSHVCDIEAING